MLINIHTHHLPATREKTILSLYKDFASVDSEGYYSIGIHPWHVGESWLSQFKDIKEHSRQKNVIAIGETGLDKICQTDWQTQQMIFAAHIQWANYLQKPLIIHCVRAWDEVLAMLTKEKVSVPVIFHGYNKNKQLAERIINQGYYLSFGSAFQQQASRDVLKAIPADRFFLETDNADISIQEVYELVASALSIDMNSLSLQLQKNAAAVFGPSFLL